MGEAAKCFARDPLATIAMSPTSLRGDRAAMGRRPGCVVAATRAALVTVRSAVAIRTAAGARRVRCLTSDNRLSRHGGCRRAAPMSPPMPALTSIVGGGQVLGRASRRGVHDPEIRLAVGPHRLSRERADECDPLAVGREGEAADRAVDARDLRDGAAGRRHAVDVAIGGVVVRLRDAIGDEIDRRAVGRPGRAALVELAAGDLLRRRLSLYR